MTLARCFFCCFYFAECSCNPTRITQPLLDQFCAEPKYKVNSMRAPQFIAQPKSGVYHTSDSVHLDCNITSVPGYTGKFLWEHNGTVVNSDSLHTVIQTGPTSSRLLLPRFSKQVQGEYRCRVMDGNYTLLSQTAMLELPGEPQIPSVIFQLPWRVDSFSALQTLPYRNTNGGKILRVRLCHYFDTKLMVAMLRAFTKRNMQ